MEHKILIVDDNPDDIEITRMVLQELKHEVKLESASCGDAALDFIRKENNLPAIILLDLKTYGMGGIETLHRIKMDENLRHIPVIIVTASSRQYDEQQAYDAGADGFLFKAIDMHQFGKNLNELLHRFLKY